MCAPQAVCATTVTCQPLVSGKYHSLEHGLIEEAVAHPLADDNVHLLYAIGQLNLFHFATN